MVIGGKTFNLAGLISESVLDLQMANVFKVLKKLNSLIETQTGQIQALQTKVGDGAVLCIVAVRALKCNFDSMPVCRC